jgi:hypothetical protein
MKPTIRIEDNVMIMTDDSGTLFVAIGRYSPWPPMPVKIRRELTEEQKDRRDDNYHRYLDKLGYSA